MRLVEVFEPFLGQWTGVEQHLVAGAEAGSARAMLVFRLDLAGAAVVQDYRRVGDDGVELTEHSVFLLTGAPDGLSWWRFTSHGEPPEPVTGARHDDELVFVGGTAGAMLRHRWRIDTAGRLLARIERTASDGDQEQVMVGAYQRISGH